MIQNDAGPFRNALSPGKPAQTKGAISDDPLAELFFFVNQKGPEDLSELKPDWFSAQRLNPISVMQLRATQLFVASAELPDAAFHKVRRLMSRRQRESADKIRAGWRSRISARMEGNAQGKADREEAHRHADLWRQERLDPALDQDLTEWLRTQGPEVWYELGIGVEWAGEGAAELVPFIEWLIAQPKVDSGPVLLLLAQAVADAIDTEAYEQHDCARNLTWMKAAHDGLMNGAYAPMRLTLPPYGRQIAEALFEPEQAGAWTLPQMDLGPTSRQPLHSEFIFIDNRPVESFEAWKARLLP